MQSLTRLIKNHLPDPLYLRMRYKKAMGEALNLTSPVTFNQKLQYLKLYDRDPRYTTMVDKVAVKDYVAGAIGQSYVIPTIGVWNTPDEIDFESLPPKFVLKCNHNSGLGMCVCKDKSALDISGVKRELQEGLAQDYYLTSREWPYKHVPRRILAEEYLENSEVGGLTDYKVHCFHGRPRFILVCKDRFAPSGLTEDFFGTDWQHMAVKRPGIPNAAGPIPRPEQLEEMLSLAETLSKDIPFVRVDFYIVDGRIFFSELTFFPASGLSRFEPDGWDRTFGDWLVLPDRR